MQTTRFPVAVLVVGMLAGADPGRSAELPWKNRSHFRGYLDASLLDRTLGTLSFCLTPRVPPEPVGFHLRHRLMVGHFGGWNTSQFFKFVDFGLITPVAAGGSEAGASAEHWTATPTTSDWTSCQ